MSMTLSPPWKLLPSWMRTARQGLTPDDWRLAREACEATKRLTTLDQDAFADTARRLAGEGALLHGTAGSGKLAGWPVAVLALYSEALRRVHGVVPHETQLIAALVLARGQIAEMATGEGKTFAAAAATVILALQGRRVHVMTQNGYLASRDFENLEPVYNLLGLLAGCLEEGQDSSDRLRAYRATIVHGAGQEFGFDYLRQQAARRRLRELPLGEYSLRALNGESGITRLPIVYDCAVVDEIDSVLIDEALLPLVLHEASGPASDTTAVKLACKMAATLQQGVDFVVDSAAKGVQLTMAGDLKIQQQTESTWSLRLVRPWSSYIRQALMARWSLKRDVDYVVHHQKVLIVDQHTGRVFADRSWQEGLHQAVEAKEAVPISPETTASGKISRQQFVSVYASLCGLTGTMTGVEREFWQTYRLRTVSIPLRKPCRREEWPDRFFPDQNAKLQAAVAEIAELYRLGRPVLVGSRTIAVSLELSRRLLAAEIPHQVLTGVQDRDEAEIIAQAGERGAVTIATNLAGRGTDIRLGAGVAELGGLHVLGLERHESRRVDAQLAGRAARQGDPGSCRFLIAADDQLVAKAGNGLAERMQSLQRPEAPPSAAQLRAVASAQQRAERKGRELRRRMAADAGW
jgi:preprotein translocase subunit SecA